MWIYRPGRGDRGGAGDMADVGRRSKGGVGDRGGGSASIHGSLSRSNPRRVMSATTFRKWSYLGCGRTAMTPCVGDFGSGNHRSVSASPTVGSDLTVLIYKGRPGRRGVMATWEAGASDGRGAGELRGGQAPLLQSRSADRFIAFGRRLVRFTGHKLRRHQRWSNPQARRKSKISS